MVDVALHVEDRFPGGLRHCVEIAVADAPIHVPDGDPVKVAPKDLADLLGGIAVGDLGGLALNKGGMPAQLRHTRFKRAARVRVLEKKNNIASTLSRR